MISSGYPSQNYLGPMLPNVERDLFSLKHGTQGQISSASFCRRNKCLKIDSTGVDRNMSSRIDFNFFFFFAISVSPEKKNFGETKLKQAAQETENPKKTRNRHRNRLLTTRLINICIQDDSLFEWRLRPEEDFFSLFAFSRKRGHYFPPFTIPPPPPIPANWLSGVCFD